MPGSYHCIFKEPNKDIFFESVLSFMGERIDGKVLGKPASPFETFKPNSVQYYKPRPPMKKKKFWIFLAILAYLLIGFIMAKKQGMKRLLLTWPAFLKK